MTQIRRQQRQAGLHIAAVSVPCQEPVHGEAVPEVVNTRSPDASTLADPATSGDIKKRRAHHGIIERPSSLVHEERRITVNRVSPCIATVPIIA